MYPNLTLYLQHNRQEYGTLAYYFKWVSEDDVFSHSFLFFSVL